MTIAPSPRGGFLREILLQLRTSWDRAFGYDFFVSYAWKDGQTYADALVDQLSAGRKYRCFLDKHDMGGGAEWRKSVRPALRRSSVLVLVATPLALESDNVFEEIRVFSTLGRPIVPVDVAGGSVGKLNDDHRLYSLLEQRIRRPEQAGDEESQRPSEAMVKFLDSSLGFVRIGRIKSFAQWSLIGIFATLAVLLGVFYLAEKAAKLQAEDRRRTAVAGQLAAQSQLSIGSSADSLALATLLAIESIHSKPTPDGHTALRNALALTPRAPLSRRVIVQDGDIADAAIDSSGRTIALAIDDRVIFRSTATNEKLYEFPCDSRCRVGFSATRVVLAHDSAVDVLDFDGKTVATCRTEARVGSVAISADGQYVAAVAQNPNDTFQALWRIDQEKNDCSPLPWTFGPSMGTAVAFSAQGAHAAIGGYKLRQQVLATGWIGVGDVKARTDDCNCNGAPGAEQVGLAESAHFERPREPTRITVYFDPSIPAAEVSSVAVSSAEGLSVWLRRSDQAFVEQVRIGNPEDRLILLGFGRGGNTIFTLDSKARVLEEWSAYGLRGVGQVSEPALVRAVAFDGRSGRLRTTESEANLYSADYLGQTLRTSRVWSKDVKSVDGASLSVDGDYLLKWSQLGIRFAKYPEREADDKEQLPIYGKRFLALDKRGDQVAFFACELEKCGLGKVARNQLGKGNAARPAPESVSALALSGDGAHLAAAYKENGVSFLIVYSASDPDADRWTQVIKLTLPAEAKSIALNGGRVAAAIGDQAFVWGVSSGDLIASVRLGDTIGAIGLSEDGRFLVSSIGPEQGQVIAWGDEYLTQVQQLDIETLIELACERIARKGLDRQTEWPLYMPQEQYQPTCR